MPLRLSYAMIVDDREPLRLSYAMIDRVVARDGQPPLWDVCARKHVHTFGTTTPAQVRMHAMVVRGEEGGGIPSKSRTQGHPLKFPDPGASLLNPGLRGIPSKPGAQGHLF